MKRAPILCFIVFVLVLLAWVIAANAQPIPGTVVAAAITTGDQANTFATAFTFEIQGTMKQVPDVATRDLISADRRTEGMMCYVTGETNIYVLEGGTNNSNWALWVSGNIQVQNFVETNIFQAIHVLTNFFDTVYVTNQLSLLYLNPNQFVVTDGADKLISSLNGVTLTNISPTNVDLVAGAGITFTTNSHQVTVSAPSSGFATNVVWPVKGTNVFLTTNGFAVTIDVPTQSDPVVTPGQSTAVRTNAGPNYSVDVVGILTNQVYGTNVIGAVSSISNAPVVSAGTGITVTTNAAGVGTNYTVALTSSSVTVNGTANHITTTSASIALGGSATLDVGSSVALVDANNSWTSSSSNYLGNAVWAPATNSNDTTPDFGVFESTLSTNAAFTFLSPTHISATVGKTYCWIQIHVTNTAAAAVLITAPANCHTVGTPYVTNWSDVYFFYNPPSGPTNMFVIPNF